MKMQPILLVEDNPDDQELIKRSLRKSNIWNDIIVLDDGVAAVEHLLGNGEADGAANDLPAVVLLDLKLPKIDGLQVLERIRGEARTKLLPVVILTSSDEEADMIRSYQLGANSYVRKPVDFVEFARAVSELGLYWLLLNELPPRSARG